MDLFSITAVLLTLAAVFAWLNHKLLRLPVTIGLMILALGFSLCVLGLSQIRPEWTKPIEAMMASIDFDKTLMNAMLGYLLFAGALHVDLGRLKNEKGLVLLLATVGVMVTTGLVGGATYLATGMLGLEVPLIYCFLFGSLIAPTDPIAVLAIMKKVGAPASIETKLTGESLFNDGVGVVVFMGLLGVAGLSGHGGHDEAHDDHAALAHASLVLVAAASEEAVGTESGESLADEPSTHETHAQDSEEHDEDLSEQVADVGILFVKEVGGGIGLGIALGLVMFLLLRFIDDYKTEVLISLAGVTGGYALAQSLHISGPLAMVVAGLFIGNTGRALAMSPKTVDHLDDFWELIDEILNAVLFVLIGLEVLILSLKPEYLIAGAIMIPLTVLARCISVGGTIQILKNFREFTPGATTVLTWAGLRGGISVALALGLKSRLGADQAAIGELILTMTYVVVCFSIIVQGLTVGPLLRKLGLAGETRGMIEH